MHTHSTYFLLAARSSITGTTDDPVHVEASVWNEYQRVVSRSIPKSLNTMLVDACPQFESLRKRWKMPLPRSLRKSSLKWEGSRLYYLVTFTSLDHLSVKEAIRRQAYTTRAGKPFACKVGGIVGARAGWAHHLPRPMKRNFWKLPFQNSFKILPIIP